MASMKVFNWQLGSMRKPQEFVVYPFDETSTTISIQSDKCCGRFDRTTGNGMLCIKSPNFLAISLYGKPFTLPSEVLKECIENQPKKGDTIANGIGVIG